MPKERASIKENKEPEDRKLIKLSPAKRKAGTLTPTVPRDGRNGFAADGTQPASTRQTCSTGPMSRNSR